MDFFTKDAPVFDPRDVEDNKVISGISYLGILFFLPLAVCPSSHFGKYNANQSLILFIISLAVNLVLGILSRIPFLGWIFYAAQGLIGLVLLATIIICLVLTIQGKAVKLPVIGDIKLIK